MDINSVSQTVSDYKTTENNKVKNNEKANMAAKTATAASAAKDDKAAEYTPSKIKDVVARDTATIEKLKLEAEERTKQLRELVEKMLMKQGKIFDSWEDTLDGIRDGSIEVDPETAAQAADDVSEDGYWGVEQTSERLFSFAKALAGNDTSLADKMIDALQKGFDAATKAWGDDLPDICKNTFEAAKKKIEDWRDGKTSEVKEEAPAATKDYSIGIAKKDK